MNLIDELGKFDGKRTAPLDKIAQRILHRKGIVNELIAFAQSNDIKIQSAATWLLKNLNEQRNLFSEAQTVDLIDLLSNLNHWDAKLHVLQILPSLTIPSQHFDPLQRNLKANTQSENKLLRAWSFNGLAVLADQRSTSRSEVNRILSGAQNDPAASVRARIRQISKSLDWIILTN
ncbi:MAG: hypothetical protein GY748_23805 [Planctomycetaceae bacterium]|nr:hypothetical protein [Planctomycetaceae bacterium]